MKTLKMGSKKRTIIIALIAVLVIAIGVYVWASVQAWNTANTETSTASTTLKKSVDDTLATQTTPELTQAALKQVTQTYSETIKEGPCELPVLYEWQSSLPLLKDTRQKCLTTAQSSDELATALKKLQAFLTVESSVALELKKTTEDTATSTDYAASSDSWKKIADSPNLSSNDSFKPVGSKINEVSKGIADAYIALAVANKDEDKTAFDTAKKNLTDSYARLTEIETVSNGTQTLLVTSVITAYEKV